MRAPDPPTTTMLPHTETADNGDPPTTETEIVDLESGVITTATTTQDTNSTQLSHATSVLEVPDHPTGGALWDQSMINFKRSAMNDEHQNEGTGAVAAHFQPVAVREPGLPTTNANRSDSKGDDIVHVPLPRNSRSRIIGRGFGTFKNKEDSGGGTAMLQSSSNNTAGSCPASYPDSKNTTTEGPSRYDSATGNTSNTTLDASHNILVTAHAVEPVEPATPHVTEHKDAPPPKGRCLPDTHTKGGKWLCFFIIIILGAVAITGILCGNGVCTPDRGGNNDNPDNQIESQTMDMPNAVTNSNPTGSAVSGFCNWGPDGTGSSSTCDGGAQGDAFCNASKDNCETGCGGRWCGGGDSNSVMVSHTGAPTTGAPTAQPIDNFYCGATFANAIRCETPCPGGVDNECPSGESCFRDVMCRAPSDSAFCGSTFASALGCGTPCPYGQDSECPPGQSCFGEVTCVAT